MMKIDMKALLEKRKQKSDAMSADYLDSDRENLEGRADSEMMADAAEPDDMCEGGVVHMADGGEVEEAPTMSSRMGNVFGEATEEEKKKSNAAVLSKLTPEELAAMAARRKKLQE